MLSAAAPPAKPRIALAVVAKVPGLGPVKTRLAPRLDEAGRRELARAFLEDKIAQARSIEGCDVVVAFTPPEGRDTLERLAGDGATLLDQRDGDLGARLAGVVEDLCERGYEGVILIDGDTPNLPSDRLREAVNALSAGRELVLGPAWDGGYYLLGVRRPRARLFERIDWSTSRVFSQTYDRALEAGLTPYVLAAWYDVDEPRDLERLERHLADAGPHAPGAPHATRALLGLPPPAPPPRNVHWSTLSGRTTYENRWLRVDEHVVRVAETGRLTLYGVITTKPCVGVVPFLDEDTVLLVRQFRYVEQRFTLEIPTGAVEAGESLRDAAQRELREEIGYRAERLEALLRYRTSKSVVDEEAHLFVGRGLSEAPLPADETEHAETLPVKLADALAMVHRGEISDSMTILGLLLVQGARP